MMKTDVEQIVLGILLAYPEHIATTDIEPADFQDGLHGKIFQSMRAVVSAGLEVDVFSVYERVSGFALEFPYLSDLQTEFGHRTRNFGQYAEILKRRSRAKSSVKLIEKAIPALETHDDPDRVRGRLITRLSELDSRSQSADLTMEDVLKLTSNHMEAVAEARKVGGTVGIPTGITMMDRDTGGLHRSNLVIIGARPAMGKTALGLTIACNAAHRGFKVGFISTEMSAVELGMRMVSLVSGIAAVKMRDANLLESEYKQVTETFSEINALPLRIYDRPSCRLSDIITQSRAWTLMGGLDLLIVDYLQRLQPDEKSESRTREVGKLATGLKTTARNLKIPVIALSQINRASTHRQDKRPTMADLRDSGEIEQEADTVWLLHRESEYREDAHEEDAEIIIEKNRHGPTGTVWARWQPEIMRWGNRESQQSYGSANHVGA